MRPLKTHGLLNFTTLKAQGGMNAGFNNARRAIEFATLAESEESTQPSVTDFCG